jgi:glycosyltransferase involved in cell wall biosynthesis
VRLAFLAPYPVSQLEPHVKVAGDSHREHPAAWIPGLIDSLVRFTSHELHVLTYSDLVDRDQYVQIDQVHYYILKRPRMKYRLASFFMIDSMKFGTHLRTIKPDLVHGHGTDSTYAYVAARCSFPYIITIQGILSQILPTYEHRGNMVDRAVNRLLLRFEEKTIRSGRSFIANTSFVEDLIKRSNPRANIYTIENVVQDIYLDTRNRNFAVADYVLFIGTISKSKGIEELIRAFHVLRRERPDLQLKIIGYGDQGYIRGVVMPLIAACNLTGLVEFCGKRPASYIVKKLEQALCLVVPSHMEQAPQAIAEAMAVGVPVVATKVGGVPQMLEDGVTGFLCPAKNEDELAKKIKLLASDCSLRVKMGRQARSIAAVRYHPRNIAAKLDEAYHDVIGNNLL